ncbi:MAG TPA: phosphoglycerate dehydrogenase [Candidatus Tectomicrobia bacterium]|nr:phosphoglycerate dehydrogenase [Candidatus Tectomicrobia bacterium]
MTQARPRIVIPDDFPPVISNTPALETLKTHGNVDLYTSRPDSQDELITRIRGAHTVVNIRAYCKFTADVLKACPGLKHLAVWGTGTDNVDLPAAKGLGILVTNTPNTATDAVAEHGMALMLAVARQIPAIDAQVKRGEWARGMLMQLAGKTLGILGTGAIGLRMAQLGRGIGMNVIAWTYHPDASKAEAVGFRYLPTLGEVLQEADVVSLHLRYSPDTEHIIGAKELALMKPTALLVNTARGQLVDQRALYEALRDGSIAGAGLDVFEQEPIDPQDPLLTLPNVVLSPHTAGTTPEALMNGLHLCAANVGAFLAGRVQNRVV